MERMKSRRLVLLRCRDCLAWSLCPDDLPGGPALCEHPNSSYMVLAGGTTEHYVECGFARLATQPTDNPESFSNAEAKQRERTSEPLLAEPDKGQEKGASMLCRRSGCSSAELAQRVIAAETALREALTMLDKTVYADACPPSWAEKVDGLHAALKGDEAK